MKLRGIPVQDGIVIGRVAISRPPFYIPEAPVELERALSRQRADEPFERLDIILITDNVQNASMVNVPWARVVGIAGQHQSRPEYCRVPATEGHDNLLELATDGMIALLDGSRGILHLEPDAEVVASYQSEAEKLRPSARYFIGYEHSPAITLDGKQVRVMARIVDLLEIEAALTAGADGLLIEAEALDWTSNEEEIAGQLNFAIKKAAGKPVTFRIAPEDVPKSELIQVAAIGDLTLSMPIEEDEFYGVVVAGLRSEYVESLGREENAGRVRMCADVEFDSTLPDSLFLSHPFERILVNVPFQSMLLNPESTGWLTELIQEAHSEANAVELLVPNSGPDELALALAADCDALIVNYSNIQNVKLIVRSFAVNDYILGTETDQDLSD